MFILHTILKIFLIVGTCVMIGCTDNTGRRHELEQREHAVAERERKMDTLEDDYNSLVKMRDSLLSNQDVVQITDTIVDSIQWPEVLIGDWNSKLICRIPGCANYVIGDQRNELWRFLTDDQGYYVQVINSGKEMRRFRASYDGNSVKLSLIEASNIDLRYSRRAVLDNIGSRSVKGSQYMTDDNNCETVFSVELTPRQP